MSTSAEELDEWLGKESGKPIHVATENTDLSAELRRGLSFLRKEKNAPEAKSTSQRTARSK